MNRVIPTVFAHSKKEFIDRFSKLQKISKNIQIDIMDGNFVKASSIKIAEILKLNKFKNVFEAHLMVSKPLKYILKLKNKGFTKIIMHYESFGNDKEILNSINYVKRNGMKIFIALNPETPIMKIIPFVDLIDGVLIMGVHPGREKQNFVKEVYEKIRVLKKIVPKTKIQVDGGVNEMVSKKLARLKVDLINSGSFVSESDNPKMALMKLNNAFICR